MKLAVGSLVAGAALALAAPAAFAAEMHPELGARLAGMGEHGVVNLQVKSNSGQLCWTFDLPTTAATGASIHAGTSKSALVRLGAAYTKKGCANAQAMVLDHLESKPGAYWIWVDTK